MTANPRPDLVNTEVRHKSGRHPLIGKVVSCGYVPEARYAARMSPDCGYEV
jgi:hypothetical protein